MMIQNKHDWVWKISLGVFLILGLASCAEEIEPNITPMAELIFFVEDEAGNPIADATVILFPFQSSYNEYKDNNRDGSYTGSPNVANNNIGTTDASGRLAFPAMDLQGNGFASGTQWVYRPNPIYVRVEAFNQNSFLTNDDDAESTRIAFGELGSGDFVTVTTDVVVK
ncbi:MAG: hypothetical protein AAGD28_23365 [Bacteroidota bacterium]